MKFLYILDINPIVSHIICKQCLPLHRSLLILSVVSLAVQKLLSLIRYFFFFFFFALGDKLKEILLIFVWQSILPMFSSRSFNGFRSLINFGFFFFFFFVYCMKKGSILIVLHVVVQFSQHHLLKRVSFLYYLFSCLLC